MKKINYLVLMAAMMLIGTNVGATTHEVATDAQFETAWKSASSGDVIKLTDAISLTKTMWLGTQNMNDASRTIEIDLNGYNLLSSVQYPFLLTHGTLKISNTRPASGQVQGTYTKYKKDGVTFDGSSNIFYVTGSTNKDVDPSLDGADYFSHLEIGEGVVLTQAHYDALITVAELYKSSSSIGYKAFAASACVPEKPALSYISNVYATSETAQTYAVAHGVRVDLKGTINGTKYGIKTNGPLGSPISYVDKGQTTVSFAGSTSFDNLKSYTIAKSDVNYSPFVYVYPTGRITVWNAAPAGTDRNPIGIYASGYARWKIEGYAEGCNGAVIKSGQVDFTDATVIGTGPVYEEATASSSGTSSSGSGIVVASTDNYAGNIEVSIGGDSEISSQNGYAIEEVITASDNKTDVETVSISGGSFEGSADQGTIKITEETTTNETTVVEVTGGQVVGADPEDPDVVNIGGLSLTEFLEAAADEGTQEKTHITVTTNEEGEKVMVIVSGETPDGYEDIFHEDEAVNWKHSSSLDKTAMAADIDEDLRLDQLQINQDYAQVVTVKDGKTLEVGSVVLGEKAQIIVEPGATFKVTKKDGIYSSKASNLILQTQAGKPSIFLFNPAVTTNAHPNATVEFTSTKSFRENATNKQYERFGLPTWTAITSIECDQPTLQTSISIFGVTGWDYCGILEGDELEGIAKLNKPFIACELLANTKTTTPTNPKYTFTGKLTGNGNATLNVDHEWTPFANSYSARIDAAALIAGLAGGVNVDQTIYLAKSQGNNLFTWDAIDLIWEEPGKQLEPMEAFILHNHGTSAEETSINYNSAVWTPATSASPAPRRSAANDFTAKLRMIVESTQGDWDNVKLSESATNSHNADKYINDNMNLYAHGNESKLAIVASENLEGTYFGFSTVVGGVFTISFADVEGREFELIDLETGAKVTVEEGNTYMFTASDNTTNDYRFKLVGAHKVPTAVDAINGEKNQSGVYTMLGQYVGEMNQWNTLPAGVYVVNGEKRVK